MQEVSASTTWNRILRFLNCQPVLAVRLIPVIQDRDERAAVLRYKMPHKALLRAFAGKHFHA